MAFDKGGQFYRNWFAFFLLGTINNFSYVLVNSSAQVILFFSFSFSFFLSSLFLSPSLTPSFLIRPLSTPSTPNKLKI